MHKLLSLLYICLPFLSVGQEKNEELIYWKDDHKLRWSDYKGKSDPSVGAAASTATYLGIDYNFSPKGLTYKITCSFSKNKSWGIHKTEYILGHEQGHFDIAEIHARMLNKKMATYKFDRNNYKTDLRKIYEDILSEKETMQNMYDAETNHSIEKEKQSEWLKKIKALLVDTEVYQNY
ncbi:MAG: DUF922 domain-containing protein [Chitinophagaceae bacterium]